MIIDTSWDDDNIEREYTGAEVLAGDQALDYALLSVKPLNLSGPSIGSIVSTDVVGLNSIFIIHHPAGRRKQITDSCSVLARKGAELFHDCDTEVGSSGAPMLNPKAELIGIHHHGYACDGSDRRNRGVAITDILCSIKAKNGSAFENVMKRLRIDGPPLACPN